MIDGSRNCATLPLLNGRRVLLIGGAGFIGHHLALRLAKEGANVHVVDSLEVNNLRDAALRSTDPNWLSDELVLRERLQLLRDAGVPLHLDDAREFDSVGRVMARVQPQVVVHLAGVAHAGRANHDPFRAFEHGLRTLASTLAISRGTVERYVFMSSSMVYGDFPVEEITEEHPLHPIDNYGALKLCGEEMVKAHHRISGLPFSIVRPCALYGPRCISRRVTQLFLEQAGHGVPMVVEGDGSDRVDFTYVDDLIEGLILVLQSTAAENETFNITSGNARSLYELANIVRRFFPSATIEHRTRDPLRPRRGTLAIDKAKRLLGYSPNVQLEEGMRRCVDALAQTPRDIVPEELLAGAM